MPTYEYQCESCGKVIEVFHAMSAPGPTTCDCPSKGKLHRLLSAGSGLIFKGSGFYITDYARKNSSPATSEKSCSSSEKTASTAEKTPSNGNSGDKSTSTSPACSGSCPATKS